jgi:hypothetical protein
MGDLTGRLRARAREKRQDPFGDWVIVREECLEAAAEIERQAKEIKRRDEEIAGLRKALDDLLVEMALVHERVDWSGYDVYHVTHGAVKEARAALERKP